MGRYERGVTSGASHSYRGEYEALNKQNLEARGVRHVPRFRKYWERRIRSRTEQEKKMRMRVFVEDVIYRWLELQILGV